MTLPSQDLEHIMEHTRDLWEGMRSARLFITGGTGFFGKWLVESFLYANQQLDLKASASILTRQPASTQQTFPLLYTNPAIILLEGDVRNFKFPQGQYSHIIHAATDASAKLNEENPLLMLDTIIEGTRHALDFAIHSKAEKFLLTSSGAIYGRQPAHITHIPEEYEGAPDTLSPNSAYGNGKRTAEFLCSLYNKKFGLNAAIARCFAFVGPHLPLDAHFAIGNFIRDAKNGGPIIIKGDGSPYRSYLYMADLTIWLWTILLRGKSGRAYNVGSEKDISIEETAWAVARSESRPIEVKALGTKNSNQAAERYVPSTQRAQIELELKQFIDVEDAIQRTFQFIKSHSAGA